MIATRTMSMMVAMSILGIVPVVAHAQQVVDLDQIVAETATADLTSDPAQNQMPQIFDQDTNTNTLTNTPINFAIVAVGPFNTGTASSDPALTTNPTLINDDSDTNSNDADQTLDAPVTQLQTQGQDPDQNPSFPVSSVNDIVASALPGTG
jgi:hypothetical protein